MSDLSNYAENALVNHLLRDTPMTSPETVYLAVGTAVSDAEAGTWTELAGNGYARQAVTFDAPTNGATANSSDVEFPEAEGDWGTVAYGALYDAPTGGNALTAIKALGASKAIDTGDVLRFAAGEITFQLS